MSVAKGTRSHTKPIIADAFTVKSQMKNAQVISPKKAGAFVQSPGKPTEFRKFYERGDFPIALEHDTKGNKIAWKVTNNTHYYLTVCTFLISVAFVAVTIITIIP